MKKEKDLFEKLLFPRIRVGFYIDGVWFGENRVMFKGYFYTEDLINIGIEVLKDCPSGYIKRKESWLKEQTAGGKKIWWNVYYPV